MRLGAWEHTAGRSLLGLEFLLAHQAGGALAIAEVHRQLKEACTSSLNPQEASEVGTVLLLSRKTLRLRQVKRDGQGHTAGKEPLGLRQGLIPQLVLLPLTASLLA